MGTLVVLSSNLMGDGDKRLGHTLMKKYISALSELQQLPDAILMYNSGVYLSVEGSAAVEDLRALEARGVEIFSCDTCLRHYKVNNQLAVGSVTDMQSIAEMMATADKIVKP